MQALEVQGSHMGSESLGSLVLLASIPWSDTLLLR